MFHLTGAFLRWSEKFALMHWLNASVNITPTQSKFVFVVATYIASLRALREPEGSPYIRRMIRLTGDAMSFNRFAKAKDEAETMAVLKQWDGAPLLPLLVKHLLKVFHELKYLILLSVLMPWLLKSTLRAWRRQRLREGYAMPEEQLENTDALGKKKTPTGCVSSSSLDDGKPAPRVESTMKIEKNSLRQTLRTMAEQLTRRTAAVMAMPAVFWCMMCPLVGNVLGGPRHSLFKHRWFLATLPTLAGICSITIEGQKRAKVLAIFMVCTAIS